MFYCLSHWFCYIVTALQLILQTYPASHKEVLLIKHDSDSVCYKVPRHIIWLNKHHNFGNQQINMTQTSFNSAIFKIGIITKRGWALIALNSHGLR